MGHGPPHAALSVVGLAGLTLIAVLLFRPTPIRQRPTDPPRLHEPAGPSERTPHPTASDFPALVVAREEVDVSPAIEGTLDSVLVRLGDRVESDDLIATIGSHEIAELLEIARAAVVGSRAELREREVQLETATAQHERIRSLYDVVSDEDRASAYAATLLANAQLEVARARLTETTAAALRLEDRLTHASVRAPFDGTIAVRYMDPGARVAAGQPIVRLMSSSDLWVRFGVSEAEARAIEPGDTVEIEFESMDLPIPGRVRHISPEVDPMVKRVLVEAQLEIPQAKRGRVQVGLVGSARLASHVPPGGTTTPIDRSTR